MGYNQKLKVNDSITIGNSVLSLIEIDSMCVGYFRIDGVEFNMERDNFFSVGLATVNIDEIDSTTAHVVIDAPESIDIKKNIPSNSLECACCKRLIALLNGVSENCVRISRGRLALVIHNNEIKIEDQDNDRINFERHLCFKCFMEDPDLCRFFNKLNLQVR